MGEFSSGNLIHVISNLINLLPRYTLNIVDSETIKQRYMTTYHEICRQIVNLTPDEQLRLLEELTTIVRGRSQSKPKHSIMELEGLGKEIWQGIDAQEYVDQERLSWDG